MVEETTNDRFSSDVPKSSDVPNEGRVRRIPRRVWLGAVVIAGLFAVVWWGLPADVPREPVILARDADGTLREQGSPNGGLTFNAQLGSLNAKNQTTCVSSSSHSNPAYFAARNLIIINQVDDVLMDRVGAELVESLKSELAFDRLEYYPYGHLPESGKLAPDFYLMLELESKTVSGLMNEQLEATVKALLGSTPARSHFHSFDHLTPPLVRLHSEVQVKHESKYLGVESSAAAYVLQGRDIAKQITSQLKSKFEDAREGHSPVPELPAELAEPEWSPTPDFHFLDEMQAEVLTSTRRLMMHNETFWRLTIDGPVTELFDLVKEELVENKWRVDHEETRHPRSSVMRLVLGTEDLLIFPADRDELPASADESWPDRIDCFIRYRKRMSQDAVRSVIDDVLAQSEPDIGLLLVLHDRASREQRPRIISLLEQHQPGTSESWIVLANYYSALKDMEGCRRSLRMLTCLKSLSIDPGALTNRISSLAKKHEIDRPEYSELTEDDWIATGLVKILEDGPAAPVEFGTDRPAGFFAIDAGGKAHVYSVMITAGPGEQLTARHLYCSDGHRSWGTGGVSHQGQETNQYRFGSGPDDRRVVLTTTRLAPDRFRAVARFIRRGSPQE